MHYDCSLCKKKKKKKCDFHRRLPGHGVSEHHLSLGSSLLILFIIPLAAWPQMSHISTCATCIFRKTFLQKQIAADSQVPLPTHRSGSRGARSGQSRPPVTLVQMLRRAHAWLEALLSCLGLTLASNLNFASGVRWGQWRSQAGWKRPPVAAGQWPPAHAQDQARRHRRGRLRRRLTWPTGACLGAVCDAMAPLEEAIRSWDQICGRDGRSRHSCGRQRCCPRGPRDLRWGWAAHLSGARTHNSCANTSSPA